MYNPWKLWLMHALGACTGRRIGEVITLRVEDFDAINSTIWLHRSVGVKEQVKAGTKTGEGNLIPIDPEIVKVFVSLLPKEGWALPGRDKSE